MSETDEKQTPPGQPESNWAALLLLASLMLVAQRLPWTLLAALPALGALVLGVRATMLRRRSGARAAAVWAGIGVVFAVWILLDVTASAVLYGPLSEYSTCHAGANTGLAEGECVDQLRSRVGSAADMLVGG